MRRKVAAHDGELATVQREADGHGALVAAHAEHTARHARRGYLQTGAGESVGADHRSRPTAAMTDKRKRMATE